MSRIGKRILTIPQGVTITQQNNIVEVSGPKGKISHTFPKHNIEIKVEGNEVSVVRKNEAKFSKQMHGTANALIANMILGVTVGWKKELQIVGVGYKAALQGNKLSIIAGYSHPVELNVPQGLKLTLPKPVEIIIEGVNKELVGEFAAVIRRVRQPNVYSGKGIMYVGEHIVRKEGKAAGKGAK